MSRGKAIMGILLAAGFMLALLVTGGWAAAQEAASVWVVNRDGGDSVSVINAATNRVVATVPVGKGPHIIAILAGTKSIVSEP